MEQATFWTLNLCLHAPSHAMLYLLNFYNPQRNKRTAKAIARGWPSFLVVIMQVSCHLTVCGQGLTTGSVVAVVRRAMVLRERGVL